MCGIAGMVGGEKAPAERETLVRRMLGAIRHRGPDQFGVFTDPGAGIGSARLSIIDLNGGQQPICNEDESLWIVFNGEIFNHPELRAGLESRGHRFSTHTDTEVILHLFEELGPECLGQLNGQFAIAIWDRKRRELFLARDRLGVRPMFYAREGGQFLFASEIKAIFSCPHVRRELDPIGLDQSFTFWAPQAPRTAFKNVFELPPGHCLRHRDGDIRIESYWHLEFREIEAPDESKEQELVDEFRALLIDAVRIRLRADVPVGAYLSGGLDSSTIASVVRRFTANRLSTFSIAFDDEDFDESAFQSRMAQELGTEHQVVRATRSQIGECFPDVVWHAEAPLLRTAPAPMFLLSRLVRESGYKVVLTGEGADEFFCGYDIFKENKVRRFWARQPDSRCRPLLLQRLYRDIARLARSRGAFLTAFFKERLTDVECPWYSHLIRWRNSRRTTRFFTGPFDVRSNEGVDGCLKNWERPAGYSNWNADARAQYWEIKTFLSPYLLASQGDRMGMANSVEGRFPFLDFRMVELASRLPSRMKLRVLKDKFILRAAARDWLPAEISRRAKRPYRAPIQRCFFGSAGPAYVRELLSEQSVREAGVFDPATVAQFIKRVDSAAPLGETDEMSVAAIISTQILHRTFVARFPTTNPIGGDDDVKCCVKRD